MSDYIKGGSHWHIVTGPSEFKHNNVAVGYEAACGAQIQSRQTPVPAPTDGVTVCPYCLAPPSAEVIKERIKARG